MRVAAVLWPVCWWCARGVRAVRFPMTVPVPAMIVALRFFMAVLMKSQELQSKKSFPLWPRSGFRTSPEAHKPRFGLRFSLSPPRSLGLSGHRSKGFRGHEEPQTHPSPGTC
eukprot:6617703-Pyramimonas_sp.AAC.1